MSLRQQSSDRLLTFEGVGLHSGSACAVTIRRLERGRGIHFERRDGAGDAIAATVSAVRPAARHTVLAGQDGEATVATTEHLLAALAGLGHWDALIEVTGPEIPILDGSALPFARALGAWKPRPLPDPVVLDRPLEVSRGSSRASAVPSQSLSVSCAVRFEHAAIGDQRATWDGRAEGFLREVAPARTFGFLDEVDELRRRGLAAGGSLDNALVYGPEGPLNSPRFADEPVRHKLLDAIGDLALLGRPLQAAVRFERPGHALVVELVRAIVDSL